jgi:Domain of unknown function (DUF4421)
MRANFILFLCCFIGILGELRAQEDSIYIRNYPSELQALSTFRYSQSAISINGHQQGNLGFEQSGVTVGVRAQFGNWGLGVTAPTRILNGDRKGRSLGLQLQLFPKHFQFNGGVTRKTGFQAVETQPETNSLLPTYQHLQMWHFYLNPIYVFSGDKFSLRATNQFTQRQLKSSGTILAALRSEYLRLNTPSSQRENANNTAFISGYNFLQNGATIGYAYNFVFWDGAFISAMAMGGVAHTKTSYKLGEEKYAFQKWQVVPSADLNLSFGYNGDKYVAAVLFNYRKRSIHSENIQMNVNDWDIQLTCGYRLYAPRMRQQLDQHGARFAQYFVPVR